MENDLIVTGGFVGGIDTVTTKTMALDLSDTTAEWRELEEYPVTLGVTHGSFDVDGK